MFDATGNIVSTALAVALFSFLVTSAAVPVATRLGRYFRLLDVPDRRKTHARAVPRTGGIAVAGGLATASLAAYVVGAFPAASAPSGSFFIAATAAVLALGLLDDIRGCTKATKLVGESVAAIVIVGVGQSNGLAGELFGAVEALGGALAGATGVAIAVVWLVGVTNAVNFMDGLDGLAGGIAGIMAVTLAGCAALQGDIASMLVALALAGACVAFLRYNWRPARVFLGDAGSLTIGFVLAWLALNVALPATGAVTILAPLLVLGLPVFDALLVMQDRYRENPDRPRRVRMRRMLQADRRHLHHLLSVVADQRLVVLGLCGFVALSCVLAALVLVRGDAYLGAGALAGQFVLIVLGRRALVLRAPAGGLQGRSTLRAALAGDRAELARTKEAPP